MEEWTVLKVSLTFLPLQNLKFLEMNSCIRCVAVYCILSLQIQENTLLWHPMITSWTFTTYLQARGLASVKGRLATSHTSTGTLEVKRVVALRENLNSCLFKHHLQREWWLSFRGKQGEAHLRAQEWLL